MRHSTGDAGLFLPHQAQPMTMHRFRFLRQKSLGLTRLDART
jgi:hypothetical protein